MKYAIHIINFLIITAISIIFGSCLTDPNIKQAFEDYSPEPLNDGWEISTPEAEGFKGEEIEGVYRKFYSEDLYPTIHSLLIVRNGKLIAEGYCRDKNERNLFHNIQSATKSVTSLLIGIAIDQGLIDSVNMPLYHFLPEYFDSDIRKRNITLHHILTMETGLDFDNDIHTVELFNGKGSSLEYVLHKDLIFLPGTDWYYGDGNPQLLSGVIKKVSGLTEEEFAKENMFTPLGIKNFQWEKHSDGLTFGAFGLWLTARDMAKIGKLTVQNGMWNGEQIVSVDWIAQSTKLQTPHQNYGYYWYPMEIPGSFYAEGHGGQLIYVVQDLQLVVVITADSYSDGIALSSRFYELFNDIVNAVIAPNVKWARFLRFPHPSE